MNNLDDLISRIGELPSLPDIASRINREIQNESVNAKLLGHIISEDTALAAKVLRLANSAFYGLQKQVTSIDKAVMVLGFHTVKNLVLSVSIFTLFKEDSDSSIDVKGLWLHSLGCAVAAKVLLEGTQQKKFSDDGFLFGILHDIGKIIFIHAIPQDYEKVHILMREKHILQADAEMEATGFNHQQIGSHLLDIWKFPEHLVQAVKYHHDPVLNTVKINPQLKDLIRTLFLGNQMAKALNLGRSSNPVREEVPKIIWQTLNIKYSQINNVAKKIKSNYRLLLESWDMADKDNTRPFN